MPTPHPSSPSICSSILFLFHHRLSVYRGQYRLSASFFRFLPSSIYSIPKAVSPVLRSMHSSLLLWLVMGCALEKNTQGRAREDGRCQPPPNTPLSLQLSHLNKGRDTIAGETTPTHAFSRWRSWHGCEHMGENRKTSLPCCVFSAYRDETRSACFVSLEKVTMMNGLFCISQQY